MKSVLQKNFCGGQKNWRPENGLFFTFLKLSDMSTGYRKRFRTDFANRNSLEITSRDSGTRNADVMPKYVTP